MHRLPSAAVFDSRVLMPHGRPSPGGWALVAALRGAGCRVAAFAADADAAAALQAHAGNASLDACIDGTAAGATDGQLPLQAAAALDLPASACAVLVTHPGAVAVAAAAGFGPVVGVAGDDGDRAAWAAADADLVVDDPAELTVDAERGFGVRTLANLPSLQTWADRIEQRLRDRHPAVFLDYDGTLTPIVADPARALLADDMRAAIEALAARCPVVVVSGRDLAHLRELLGIDGLVLAGSHGFEIAGPPGSGLELSRGESFVPALERAEAQLRERLAGIAGHQLERKRFTVAVHYRHVATGDLAALDAAVGEVLSAEPQLRRGHGKKVFEVRPAIDWHKGEAVRWILPRLPAATGESLLPLYVGDDLTDEDAFRALPALGGIGIAVRHGETRPTAADCAVDDTDGVLRLLRWLTEAIVERGHPRGTASG